MLLRRPQTSTHGPRTFQSPGHYLLPEGLHCREVQAAGWLQDHHGPLRHLGTVAGGRPVSPGGKQTGRLCQARGVQAAELAQALTLPTAPVQQEGSVLRTAGLLLSAR